MFQGEIMSVIRNTSDLKENIELFEKYLCEGSEEEQIFCQELIKKGLCFVAYKIGKELSFAPSRYIGYQANTLEDHEERDKDGKETNSAINKILGSTLEPDTDLEEKYQKFCNDIGVIPDNRNRKFWKFNISGKYFSRNSEEISEFPEGRIIERTHKARERNQKLITQAKNAFIKNHDHLFCEACGFDFEKKYGSRGKGFIEGHHDVPVCEMKANQKTCIGDISMVCANCHRILHRTRPWLSVKELKTQVKK